MNRLFSLISTYMLTIGLVSAASPSWTSTEAAFDSANAHYAAGDFEAAKLLYGEILMEHLHFESEYNMGNACYKLNELGPAILHYERAQRLNPANGDVESNLLLANTKVIDRIEALPTEGITDLWERIVAPGRFRLWMRIAAIFWTLGFATFAIRLWQKPVGTRRILGSIGSGLTVTGAICIGLMTAASARSDSSHEAIILATQTEVLNAPDSNNSTPLFVLHEGTKVRIIQQKGGWMEVALLNGNVGWLPVSDIEEI